MKKLFAGLLAVAALCVCVMVCVSAGSADIPAAGTGASAVQESVPSAGLAYADNGNGTCTLSSVGICTDTEIVIPPYYNGMKVTVIGDRAFADHPEITSIVIPDTVYKIGTRAFYNTGITEIRIPESVTSIGTQIFYKANQLKTIYYNSSYYDASNPILNNANYKVVFEKTVPNYVCRNCTALKEVVIGDGVTSIGGDAFYGCSGLTSITIPDSVTSIGSYAFYGCTNLTDVYVSDLASWWNVPFGDDYSNPMDYASNLYVNGELLTNVTIPDGMESIANYAFYNCTSLTSVTIPDSVTSIGDSAFQNCTGLTSITIPDSVTSIGYYAFDGCSGLTSVTIPDSVTSIGDRAFSDCTGLTSATIPDSVTSIGYETFYRCTGLTSVTIPDSVTSIGSYAFYGCTGLTSVTIPESVTSIEIYAFRDCTGLTSISYGGTKAEWESISIDSWAFMGCPYDRVIICTDGMMDVNGNPVFIGDFGILTQPVGQEGYEGGKAIFAVGAEGDGLAYRWQYRLPGGEWADVDAPDAGTDTLTVRFSAEYDGAVFRCGVSDRIGQTAVSEEAALTVKYQVPFTLYTRPVDTSVGMGETAIFFVSASGNGLTYQWQTLTADGSWTNYFGSGAQTAELSVVLNAENNGSRFRCVIEDEFGDTIITAPAALSRKTITLLKQPAGIETYPGTVTFSVAADGDGLTWQWYYSKDGGATWTKSTAASAKTENFSVKARKDLDGYLYRCVITDACGETVTSAAAALTVRAALEITAQPADVLTWPGTVTFAVKAGGDGLSYQWYYSKNGGETWTASTTTAAKTASFPVNAREEINGYLYRCVITDAYGDQVTSGTAALTVRIALDITAQPEDVPTAPGAVIISVGAKGDGLTYQWYYSKDGGTTWVKSTAASAKTADFSVNARKDLDGYRYRCVIKDAYGNQMTSGAALLTVHAALTVTAQPADLTTAPKSVTFTVKASGDGLTYQWYYSKDGGQTWVKSTSASAKTAAIAVNARKEIGGYLYRCTVADCYGQQVTSDAALLTVGAELKITAQPTDLLTAPGSVNFTVKATGDGLTYQWYYSKDGGQTWVKSTAASAKTTAIAVNARKELSGYLYRCVIKDAYGQQQTSDAALLTVGAELKITAQPTDLLTAPGSVNFTVKATGDGLTYQWYYSKDGGQTWVKSTAASAKTAAITVNARKEIGGYLYRCTVTDCYGRQVTSEAALLTVADYSLGLDFAQNGNTYTVTGIGTCTDTDLVIPSEYNGLPVAAIGENAFSECMSLTSVTIPDSVTSIGEWAFSGCTGLTSVTIPDSVTSICGYVFCGCWGLTSVMIPDSVTSIEEGAFCECTGLTSVTIPDSVTRLSGFGGCTGLTSVTIPDSVTSIDPAAFASCTGLTSVTIPDSVTSIGSSAFYGCTSMNDVFYGGSKTEWGRIYVSGYAFESCPSTLRVHCTDGDITL